MSDDAEADAPAAGGSGTAVSDETRGTADRGLFPERPVETLATIVDHRTGQLGPCSSDLLSTLEHEMEAFQREVAALPAEPSDDEVDRVIADHERTIHRIVELGGLASVIDDATTCLLRRLHLIDRALTPATYEAFPQWFMDLADQALGVVERIRERTKAPFFTMDNMRENPPLDAAVLTLPPLHRLEDWERFAGLRTGRTRSGIGTVRVEPPFAVADVERIEQHIDALASELESAAARARIEASSRNTRMPVFRRSMATLREMTFADVQRDTRARFQQDRLGDRVLSTVGLVAYNSVYTALLDRRGNPVRIPGVAPYGLLVSAPGNAIVRRLNAPGLYVSFGPLASYQLQIVGPRRARPLVFSGAFGLQQDVFGFSREELGTEVSKHDLQHRLQRHLEEHYAGQSLVVIITEDAFASGDLSWSGLHDAVYRLIPLIAEFVLDDIQERLRRLPAELAERVADLAVAVIREVIEDEIREWAIEWLVKKVGKKIIPGVNLISAISDAVTGGDSEKWRNVAACLIMPIRSGKPDDYVISSKVLSKIAVDEVADAVVEQLVKKASSSVSKSIRSGRTPAGSEGADAPATEPLATESPPAGTPVGDSPPDARPAEPSSPQPSDAERAAPQVDRVPFDRPPQSQVPRQPPPGESTGKSGRPADARARTDRSIGDRGKGDRAAGDDLAPPRPSEANEVRPGVRRRPRHEVDEARRARAKQRDVIDRLADDDDGVDEDRRARDRREVHDDLTEDTGRGQKRRDLEVRDVEERDDVQLDASRTSPGRSEPAGRVTGMIGELEERVHAGLDPETDVEPYWSTPKVMRDRFRDEVVQAYADDDRDGLNTFLDQLDLPPEGMREVEIPAPAPRRTSKKLGPDDGSRTRRYDRVYRDPDTGEGVLVEAKKPQDQALEARSIKRQVANDEAILDQFDGVRIEVFVNGPISAEALAEYQRLEAKFPDGGYRIIRGPLYRDETPDERTTRLAKSRGRRRRR